jgi:hypothetical protein
VARKTAEAERKERVEQLRRAQQQADRRRTLLVIGAAGALVAVLVGGVVWAVLNTAADRDMGKIGLSSAAASCDAVVESPKDKGSVHVGPGTDKPDVQSVKYSSVPPTNGEHFASPEYPSRAFYTAADRPKIENLVHNLEHGYTVVWYTESASAEQKAQLEKIAGLARKDEHTAQKFVVSAWDEAYGKYPAGKTVGISHWGLDHGYRQMCGAVSGEAIKSFVEAHPWSDAPEPNAQ